ncbi:MAG TPA: ABC transporter ATP-binding protein, partial [Longimicrobiales bacterium]|nr:ABC transporter ATP-binding protein [Longimicrobiales bacterium]
HGARGRARVRAAARTGTLVRRFGGRTEGGGATAAPAAAGGAGRDPEATFEASGLTLHYPGAAAPALAEVSLTARAGRFTAVLGPNSSGKSTLLRVLLGVLAPDAGEARYRGRPVPAWDRRALAREVGVVPQSEEIAFPLSVRELARMGRYPHLGLWRAEGARDRAAVDRALARADVLPLADRLLYTLSGGERQRARIARALAQEPRALVLDEPTASLDIRHEMGIFRLLRELADDGVTVLAVTHNLNLAARFADHLVLLQRGRAVAAGRAAAVLREDTVSRVYGWPVDVVDLRSGGRDDGAPQVIPRTAPPATNEPDTPPITPDPRGTP